MVYGFKYLMALTNSNIFGTCVLISDPSNFKIYCRVTTADIGVYL
jgi:hypothetical protein